MAVKMKFFVCSGGHIFRSRAEFKNKLKLRQCTTCGSVVTSAGHTTIEDARKAASKRGGFAKGMMNRRMMIMLDLEI